MTNMEFLSHLRQLGIRLWVDEEQLRYRAPKGVLTPSLRRELIERKTEIVAYLNSGALFSALPSLQRISRDRKIPLSFAQQRLWFIDQLTPHTAAYHISQAIRLTGPLDFAVLKRSLHEIIRRHEVLRTTVRTVDNQQVQLIAPSLTVSLPGVELSDLPEAYREAKAQELIAEHAQKPFDLSRGPLLRTTLLRLASEEHIFILTIHHLVFDGWSQTIFFRELGTLIEAFSKGKPSPLPELPFQYADVAVWQQERLQGEVLQNRLAYWKRQLADAPPILELPTDRPRPAMQTFRGVSETFTFSQELLQALKAFSQQEGATLFMTLLAAFKVLLLRYTGQKDIVVGTPVANRNHSKIENLIGFFVNTLVIRTKLSGDLSFRELLSRVRQVTLEAYAHQELPFEKLVEEVQPERHLSHNPLFQVMFAFQSALTHTLELGELTLSSMKVESRGAQFDLIFSLEETPQELTGEVEYNTDLFDKSTVVRMVGHFENLLTGLIDNPDQLLGNLPLLTKSEHQQLLEETNNKQVYSQDRCLHERFEAQVKRTPQAVALVHGQKQLTYKTLNQRANQLAHYLKKLGVGPEVLVGICVERSLEMVVGILGILKAGGAYVPLNPTYPKKRLAFMLADSQVPVLLTQQQFALQLPTPLGQMICLDSEWSTIANEAKSNPVSGVTVDNLAYLIYTSGSTGHPKGCLIPHRNVLRLFDATDHWFKFNQWDIWTLFHSIAFDFSVWELWGALLYGGRLVLVPYLVSRSPKELYELLCQQQVTVLNQTPSAFQQLIRTEQSLDSSDKLALRLVIFGGEALSLQSLQPWGKRHNETHPQLVNMYGITETTVHVTFHPITKDEINQATGNSIGVPIPDLQLYLLDQSLQAVPMGVPGEIFVGGAGLARGYLNRPALTAERFIPHPFTSQPGARLYKTGDLARYLPDGTLQFLGRLDNQVKIRGFRIELGEIEAVLNRHQAVQETIVLAREEEPDTKRLVAYVVPQEGLSLPISDLRSYLSNQLPDYMLPAAFVQLESLPLTANGKVNRRVLPVPNKVRPELATAFVAPRTQTEKSLSAIWSKVLKREQVGIYDNFFELGGHSLLATQLISQVRDVFQVDLPLRHIFEMPTILELSQAINKARSSATGLKKPPLMRVSRDRYRTTLAR